MANISISQLQQKIERIEQFREEVDTIKAESLGWKEGIDRLAAEKETARAQLSSVESQLQGMKVKSSAQARKIEELEARLASEFSKAEADAIVAIYQADAEAAQALALHKEAFSKSQAELSRCETDFRGLSEVRNALKLLSRQKEEEIKDLRAELAKAYQD
ncbi:uncharacterized protein [Nicotiana tomentosiformis]|uniref:uncharacterized protein n=1 Tax=Nicotiana tomentosiformis TaxID=4098 RepID=UPI00388CDBFE